MSSDLESELQESEALLDGHFRLSSGKHSDRYVQCARLLQWPERAGRAGQQIGDSLSGIGIDLVVAPAMGGLVIGHEVARALGVRGIFTERVEGKMALRRGFQIEAGERLVVVEDVVTTGGSTREVLELVRSLGGTPVAVASVIDRSGGTVEFDLPFRSILGVEAHTWSPAECPLCAAGEPVVKPGSRPVAS